MNAAMVAELAKRFEEAWAAERAVEHLLDTAKTIEDEEPWEAANLATQKVVDEIESMKATTLEGLRLKARAVQWCHGNDTVDLRCDQDTTNLRLATSIVEDLLRGVAL